MEPRHFLRRLIAAVIDFVLLSQLVFYMIVPFANGERVRLSGGLYQSVICRIVPLSEESRAEIAVRGVEAKQGSLCKSYQNGLYAGATLLVSSHTNAQGDIADDATTVSVSLDFEGQEVQPFYPVAYAQPVLVFALMVMLTFFMNGQTIGKNVMRIRLVTTENEVPDFTTVLRRETLKYAPAILLYIAGLMAPAYSLEQVVPLLQKGEDIALVLGFLGMATFIYILWWVAPMLWWNGAMPYDRLSKTKIVLDT